MAAAEGGLGRETTSHTLSIGLSRDDGGSSSQDNDGGELHYGLMLTGVTTGKGTVGVNLQFNKKDLKRDGKIRRLAACF